MVRFLHSTGSVHFAGDDHLKLGDGNVETIVELLPVHEVRTRHFAQFSDQVAIGRVAVYRAGFQDGLQSDDTIPFNFAYNTVGIPDDPVPSEQLHRIGTAIFDGDVVAEQKFFGPGVGVAGQILRFNFYGDAVGGANFHVRTG